MIWRGGREGGEVGGGREQRVAEEQLACVSLGRERDEGEREREGEAQRTCTGPSYCTGSSAAEVGSEGCI